MRRTAREVVGCRWWMIGLLVVFSVCVLIGQAGRANADMGIESRVACQRAIEEVYWKHTLWPEANTSPKPPLNEVMSEEEVRKKVGETLRMSKALEVIWRQPVEGYQLQAEMERMAETTRNPEMLRELWFALGNDPQLVADVLARQTLVERLIHDWYAFDERFHGRLKKRIMRKMGQLGGTADMKGIGGEYREVEWRKGSGKGGDPSSGDAGKNSEDNGKGNRSGDVLKLSEDEWQDAIGRLAKTFGVEKEKIPLRRVSELQEDEERFYVMEVLRKGKDRLKVAVVEWRKVGFDAWWSRVGERFAPEVEAGVYTYNLPEIAAGSSLLPLSYASNTWSPTAVNYAPTVRYHHTAVWTGTEMIVWGGISISGSVNTGGRYNPATNTWRLTATTGAPGARAYHTAVWTGTEMIVWGGSNGISYFNTGGRYNPTTSTWTATTTTDTPNARHLHAAVWTGTQMIVWGGYGTSLSLSTGGRYNPATNTWTSTATTGAPTARYLHTMVWTCMEMIVWGGHDKNGFLNTGGRYNPATNTWTATATTGAPTARYFHTMVWTGTQVIVWGGNNSFATGFVNTGGRYNPSTNTWTTTALTGAPSARAYHTAVWTGTQMIVWGGGYNTGGRYNPATNTWTVTATTGAPSARNTHTAVWTGTQMIVWGGTNNTSTSHFNTGGRYNPATNSWTSTALAGAPSARTKHTAVWTGTQIIVWGGGQGYWGALNTGGRYNPATNSWIPTTTIDAPSARFEHTAVWTGTQMIVWGGGYNTGGRYNLATNSWTSTALAHAPSARTKHTAVWTGTEMIVWGGYESYNVVLNTGGCYNPATNSWAATSTADAPSARYYHTAVWTGTEMIVWGGVYAYSHYNEDAYMEEFRAYSLNTGGRYSPATNTWMSTAATIDDTYARDRHTAVWTGTQMIIWGGIQTYIYSLGHYEDYSFYLNNGACYNPATNMWMPTTETGAPSARFEHTAVWTGTQMIVWGGGIYYDEVAWGEFYGDGGRYSPATNTWTTTTLVGAPSARLYHTAVWTGTQMIVWGGGATVYDGHELNTGALYSP